MEQVKMVEALQKMMRLSRKDFIAGTLTGAAVLAAPRAFAKGKGEKMDNDLHIVYIAEVLAVRRCR